mmetsp:Transcript_60920/g.137251  ORF Transcript_60920/g.137251 Transcript_60920/m.137251 type:complete len:393 (-) Transcript_60920:378-1556(-)
MLADFGSLLGPLLKPVHGVLARDASLVPRTSLLQPQDLLDAIELDFHILHKVRYLAEHLLVLVEEHVHVYALGISAHAHAALDERVYGHLVVLLHIDEHKEGPGLREVEAKRVEVCLDAVVLEMRLELLPGQRAGLVGVGLLKYVGDVVPERRHSLQLLLYDNIVILQGLHPHAVDEGACDCVEHAENHEEDVEQEDEPANHAHFQERHVELVPVPSAADGHEQGIQRLEQRSEGFDEHVELRIVRVVDPEASVSLIFEVIQHCVQDGDGEHVHREDEQDEDPEQREHGVHDGVDHEPQASEEAHHAYYSQDPRHADDPQDAHVGKVWGLDLLEDQVREAGQHEERVERIPDPVLPADESTRAAEEPDQQLEREEYAEEPVQQAEGIQARLV